MKAYVLEDKYGYRFGRMSTLEGFDPFVIGWRNAAYWFDKDSAEIQQHWLSENQGVHVFLKEIDFSWIIMELDK